MADDREDFNSEDDVSSEAHNKLLDAVSKMYKKKRVEAPTRKEPTLEISEFHLTQPETRKKTTKVRINDLVKVLNKRSKHDALTNKLKQSQIQSKTLLKPLEKPQAERIGRAIGYQNIKNKLNRWDPIVYQQRIAEHVTFPLRQAEIKEHKSNDFLTTFRTPTELEVKMAEILKASADIETKANEEKEKDKVKEGDEFPLTLAEIVDRRQLMAKVRAQQSYRQAKAARQSKIKSKKFHRIQKRERVKTELKEFEELQKKDPEAALKKLDQLERTRAEERASLRHKSTGQWAKNLTVRAKYDKEARIALSEQLHKSRQLTQKLQTNKDTSDEEDGEDDDSNELVNEKSSYPNNPWVEQTKSEVQEFYSGYKKYWENKNKTEVNQNTQLQTNNKVKSVNVDNNYLINGNLKENNIVNVVSSKKESVLKKQRLETSNSFDKNVSNGKLNKEKTIIKKDINNVIKKNLDDKKRLGTVYVRNVHKRAYQDDVLEEDSSVELANKLRVGDLKYTRVNKELRNSNVKQMIIKKSGAWIVTPVKQIHQKKASEVDDELNNNIVSANGQKKKVNKNAKTSIKDLMVKMDNLEEKVIKKIKRKNKESIHVSEDKNEMEESESENIPSLEMKKRNITADIDEELDEVAGPNENQSKGFHNIKKLIVSSTLPVANTKEVNSTDDIDPKKFLTLTPKYLKSQVPDLMQAGEQLDDEEEDKEEQRHLTISEAFADDDIVGEFRKEKEEEVKKGQIENIDLSLPGWGSWGGPNLPSTTRRKKKRFIVKFPKVAPRKDDNKGNVIINEDKDLPLKEHRVTDLPFPFTSVKDYEASIRAPIGSNWVPQTAHRKLIVPPVLTKMGTIIDPMDENQLTKTKDLKWDWNN